jgi:hypothetical protein
MVCVFFIYAKRQRDLGEELLSVAPDLHGSLAAYVLCRLYRLSARFRAVLVIVKLVQETKTINKVGGTTLTLYTAPGTAMLLQGFQEEPVLILGPFLPLLGYRVWLACLNGKWPKA